MKYCNSCKLTYEAPLKHCLFCNNELIEFPISDILIEDVSTSSFVKDNELSVDTTLSISNESIGNYPIYRRNPHIRRIFTKIIFFLVIIASFVCGYIDYITNQQTFTWSIYVIASSIFAFIFFLVFTSHTIPLSKITQIVLYSQVLIGVIAFHHDSYYWFTDIVLPVSITGLNLFVTCHLFGKKQRIYDYSVYVILISILGLFTGLLLRTPYFHIPWGIITCITYSSITLLAILFFTPKAMREELYRRLHF